MTSFLDLVAGWARVFSSHQENIPAEYYYNEADEEKSGEELLVTFRKYWGDDAVDQAIKHVEDNYPVRSKYYTRAPSRTSSGSSVSS